ncbi:hypothetical protein GCK32_013112 [Trichostrongylus colubriformis]|uniref:Nucleotide-diphospho-sugar transferase domain-containing protein n=1 Tax=Trichostrongylus colubriformis TaxID=6319 RepID=A0AAN8F5F6_TRICO
MRKILSVALFCYVIAHTVYFIYSLVHVPYSRREFSKRDLSDGPLVLKDGAVVKKGKVVALNKTFQKKTVKQSKHTGDTKTGNGPSSRKLSNSSKTESSVKMKNTSIVDSGFIKNFTKEAKMMSSSRQLIYFTVVNGAFERLTLNWLCNVAIFKGSHELLLIVSTSKSLCESVQREYGQSSVRFVLIEADSTWFRDPVELFLNATVVDDADIVTPVKGLTHTGDSLAFSPMLVEPTNGATVLFNEIYKRVSSNTSLYDQDVLNELCSTQYHGIVCRTFEYSDIADGKWFYLIDKDKRLKQPYIVNNNFYVGRKNKEARQACNQWSMVSDKDRPLFGRESRESPQATSWMTDRV